MEEEIQVEERSADEAGKDGNDVVVDVDELPWVASMEAHLDFKFEQCQPCHSFSICRVPRDIRRVDDVAHDPSIVSIGPYHRGNRNLVDMEEVKWRNLKEFRSLVGNDFIKYLKAMKEIELDARACYSGNIVMEEKEFIEMMLLDGLFIIELFRTRSNTIPSLIMRLLNIHKEEPIYTIRGMLCRVGHDMLLLENQLPFFVLQRLWKLTDPLSGFGLCKSAFIFLSDYALPFKHEWDLNLLPEEGKKGEHPEMINEDDVHHLLHLVYFLLIPTSLKPKSHTSSGSTSKSMEPIGKPKMKTLSFLPDRCRHCFRSPSAQESQSMECTAKLPAVIKKILPFLSPEDEKPPPLAVIPSAVELVEAGVVFKCVKAQSFLDVKFEHGTMKMARLSVEDSTKPLLRNFIAYEQCFPNQCFPNQGNHFTSYCILMDQLVNTRRDVEILKKSNIIENWLGSDKEVALLFNDLGKGVFLSGLKRSYLGESFKDVMKHTQKTCPKWQAKLNHDYFSNPWAIISVLAATFVIILTAVQTYYAVVA